MTRTATHRVSGRVVLITSGLIMASLLSGCATGYTVFIMGRKEGHIYLVSRVAGTSDKVALEFAFSKSDEDPRYPVISYYNATVDSKYLFSQTEHNLEKWRLRRGKLPHDSPPNRCIVLGKSDRRLSEVNDICSNPNSRTILKHGSYEDHSAWRPFALPIAIPLAVAADIAVSPIYFALYLKCRFGPSCK